MQNVHNDLFVRKVHWGGNSRADRDNRFSLRASEMETSRAKYRSIRAMFCGGFPLFLPNQIMKKMLYKSSSKTFHHVWYWLSQATAVWILTNLRVFDWGILNSKGRVWVWFLHPQRFKASNSWYKIKDTHV